MIADILTVMWKERKGLFRFRGRRSQAILSLLSPIFLAIYLPWDAGKDWVSGGISLLVAVIVPFILVGISIPDSFAGERERHTLGTLLATRLSDKSILIGKILTSILFGWLVTLGVLGLSLLTVNVVHWDGTVMFFTPVVLFADIMVSLLVAGLTAGLGVQFSLRAATVQQAQQATMSVMMLPLIVIQFGFLIILKSAGRDRLREIMANVDFAEIILIVVAVLLVLDLGLFLAARLRFRRPRLILD